MFEIDEVVMMPKDTEELSTALEELKINTNVGPCIICDAWYGFPKEGRPRKERILAVSKQIHNFTSWRSNYMKEKTQNRGSQVFVIGEASDVECINERVIELEGKEAENNNNKDVDEENYTRKVSFLPGKKLEDLAKELLTGTTIDAKAESKQSIMYLSPDAKEKLNASKLPPRIVVVGMLVDRKVQPNRSKLRAESLGCRNNDDENASTLDSDDMVIPVQLPLDALHVKDLCKDEPLNIDTVMEMMERWWINSHKRGEAQGNKYFIDAAARALLTHRQRHPKRVLHGGASELLK